MPLTLEDDQVWFDEPRKLERLCREVSDLTAKGISVLLLSHFQSTQDRLTPLLKAHEIGFEQFASLYPAALCSSSMPRVWLGLARGFRVPTEPATSSTNTSIKILVSEHHPMFSQGEEIRRAAARVSCDVQLCFYFSLDEPLLRHFGSDTIKGLFERLSADKDEALSHHLINTAIRTAQEKIEKKVGKEMPTHSAEDWFRYNLHESK